MEAMSDVLLVRKYCEISTVDGKHDGCPKFSVAIEWTVFGEGKKLSIADGFASYDMANKIAIKVAKDMGWTPPKWWQFWRWTDTRLPAEEA